MRNAEGLDYDGNSVLDFRSLFSVSGETVVNDSDLAAYFPGGERRHPRGGGRRRRYVVPGEAAVWNSGRWGPKRVRVTQCAFMMTAEAVYDQALREGKVLVPGDRLRLSWSPLDGGRTWETVAELRPNAVWRHGRLFLHCPHCGDRATRLYVPMGGLEPRCRSCWGLTYESRQRGNYKDIAPRGLPAILGTQRDLTQWQTEGRRERRREASAKRWAERKALKCPTGGATATG